MLTGVLQAFFVFNAVWANAPPCESCWPGSSGPCKSALTVCYALSGDVCPSGTVACESEGPPVDCTVSEWGEFGPCSVECGSGLRTRSRTIVTPASGGGTECPSLTEQEACNEVPCPTDCTLSEWSYGTCNCDSSSRDRTRTVIVPSQNGGAQCGALSETVSCSCTFRIEFAEQNIAVEAGKAVYIEPSVLATDGTTVLISVSPSFPSGLSIDTTTGVISGTVVARFLSTKYAVTMTAVSSRLRGRRAADAAIAEFFLGVRDTEADAQDLLAAVGQLSYEGYWSRVFAYGEASFPVFASGGDPLIAAGHQGRGRVVSAGHPEFFTSDLAQNRKLAMNCIEWAAGATIDAGIGSIRIGMMKQLGTLGASLSGLGEVRTGVTAASLLQGNADLHAVVASLQDLPTMSSEEIAAMRAYIDGGGGLVWAGYAWYFENQNKAADMLKDFAPNQVLLGNMLVSHTWLRLNSVFTVAGPANVALGASGAIGVVRAAVEDPTSAVEATLTLAKASLLGLSSVLAWEAPFAELVWSPLLDALKGFFVEIREDLEFVKSAHPIETVLVDLESSVLQLAPAALLEPHGNAANFPGGVDPASPLVSKTISVPCSTPGMLELFDFGQDDKDLKISTGLYAPPGAAIAVTLAGSVEPLIGAGLGIQVGIHTDDLSNRPNYLRYPKIVRKWRFASGSLTMDVGNSFGGPVYVLIPQDATTDMCDGAATFDVSIANALQGLLFQAGETEEAQFLADLQLSSIPWVEFAGSAIIFTVPLEAAKTAASSPTDLIAFYDSVAIAESTLSGFDSVESWGRVERYVFDVQITNGYMHSGEACAVPCPHSAAGYPIMTLSPPEQTLDLEYVRANGHWGLFHELGHNHEWIPFVLPGLVEPLANLWSIYITEDVAELGVPTTFTASERGARVAAYFSGAVNFDNWDGATALESFLMIKDALGWKVFTDAWKAYYALAVQPSSNEEKYEAVARELSLAAGKNLAPFFREWGVPLREEAFDELLELPVWSSDPLRTAVEYPPIFRAQEPTVSTIAGTTLPVLIYDSGTGTDYAASVCWDAAPASIPASADAYSWITCASAVAAGGDSGGSISFDAGALAEGDFIAAAAIVTGDVWEMAGPVVQFTVTTVSPVDCVLSDWGDWSSCSVDCGGGTSTRTRSAETPASNGGAECIGELEEAQDCNTEACPVDSSSSEGETASSTADSASSDSKAGATGLITLGVYFVCIFTIAAVLFFLSLKKPGMVLEGEEKAQKELELVSSNDNPLFYDSKG